MGVAVSRTRFAVQTALRRRDSMAVFAGVAVVYLVAYLTAVGHLSFGGRGIDLLVVDDPLSRAFEPIGYGQFEPIARLELPVATFLFSPVNTLVGLGLAGLVGLNLALTYLAWRQPQACGFASSSTGALAGLPALLSGAACCGPVVLIVLGVQASGVLLTVFDVLLPVAAVLLVGSLLWVGRKIDPSSV
ncbi:hypothetical protein FXF75_18360 [Halorussus sp. MSC15.2]|nr:hypothetical protein [Halorussus sp. MSC15.2]